MLCGSRTPRRYVEQYIGQWDYMAGALIVKEAGGIVTNYAGEADFTQGNSVVATNGIIQQDLLSVISKADYVQSVNLDTL